MNRRRRTEILIRGNHELAKKICNQIEETYLVKVIQEPNYGMVMTKCRESGKKSLFYLGEVLVTECKVSINGYMGLGLVQGDDEQLSYALAVIDAAYLSKVRGIEEWNTWLEEEEAVINKEAKLEEQKILATKVNFSTMNIDV